jgi:hypothetical protein
MEEENKKRPNFKNSLDREKIIKKWEDFGLLDGLRGYCKSDICKLYESQTSFLLNEVESEKEFPSVLPIAIRIAKQMSYNWMDLGMIKYEIEEDRIMF